MENLVIKFSHNSIINMSLRQRCIDINARVRARLALDIAKFPTLFKAGKESDYISVNALNTMAKNAGLELSSTRIGMIMRDMGYTSSRKRIAGKSCAIYRGVKPMSKFHNTPVDASLELRPRSHTQIK